MSNAEQSAYPHTRTVRDGGYMKTITEPGLTKRELFAAMAMQGFCANPSEQFVTWAHAQVAQNSVAAADALLTELAKESV